MFHPELVIIRRSPRRVSGSFSSITAGRNAFVEVDDNKPRTIELLQRDNTVIGYGPNLPTSLVAPRGIKALPEARVGRPDFLDEINIGATSLDGSGISVAVLDTGINSSHAAFNGHDLVTSSFVGENVSDKNGHGTHCAGVLFGRGAKRMSVAPGVKRALIAKVLDDEGQGTAESLFKGLLWAASEGAELVSLSLGFDFAHVADQLERSGVSKEAAVSAATSSYVSIHRAFDRLASAMTDGLPGCPPLLLLAASGNESSRNVNPRNSVAASALAASDKVLAVGAMDTSQRGEVRVASFSNHGVDFCAPGVDILGPSHLGGYVLMTGTSMATPIAVGVAALWAQYLRHERGRTLLSELESVLRSSSRWIAPHAADPHADCGSGIVQGPMWNA